MFALLKKKRQQRALDEAIDRVAGHLKRMGYDITTFGRGAAGLLLAQGRREVGVAGEMAVVTMAQDVKAAGSDIRKLAGFMPHGMALLQVLRAYKDAGNLTEEVWQFLSQAIYHLAYVDEKQEGWIEGILRTPLNIGSRVAISRIRASQLSYDEEVERDSGDAS
jgi:hypothetical protein